ncbi:Lar family restriction alleviation protein [Atlantibacter hermannii]|uniref:Lar family restriction alleviation protein n=1 Tax=Atlantibacter hermannii TaxID=565 RepID=UPI0035E3F192
MSELKPCPFCNNPIIGLNVDKAVYGNKWSFADCPACGCRGPFGLTEEQGINLWNQRVSHEANIPASQRSNQK